MEIFPAPMGDNGCILSRLKWEMLAMNIVQETERIYIVAA
jgi:hypothetical protein